MYTDAGPGSGLPHSGRSAGNPAWFNPAVLILIPTAMSFLAWSLLVARQQLGPGQADSLALNGFSSPAQVSGRGVALLMLWYLAIVMVSMVGFWWGSHRSQPPDATERTGCVWFERRYFLLLLSVGAIGVGYTFWKVGGIPAIVDSLSEQTANDFSNALPGFAGPQTFRYATILAAPIGVHLWRRKVIGWPYMMVAVMLLIMNSFVASRLSLLMAATVFLAAWVRSRRPRAGHGSRAQTWISVVVIALSGFAVLTALNYVRNANYYRAAGVSNPVAMNMYQSGAYLAVPAQVSLGVADAVGRGSWEKPGGVVSSLDAVQPTFLQFNKVAKDDSWKQASVYGYSVTFAGNFFTNSVFADTYATYGAWGWLYTILAYGVAGYAFARIFSFSPVIAASAGVVAYGFLEVWRVQILSYGIVVFLLLLTAGCAWAAAGFRLPRRGS